MKKELINNRDKKRYELHIGESIALIEYIQTQDKIFLTHTEVPKPLEGKGIGSALVKAVLEDIEKKELSLIPLCPFVAAFIKRNQEWQKLVSAGVNIK